VKKKIKLLPGTVVISPLQILQLYKASQGLQAKQQATTTTHDTILREE
jgi:hypothetical protein